MSLAFNEFWESSSKLSKPRIVLGKPPKLAVWIGRESDLI